MSDWMEARFDAVTPLQTEDGPKPHQPVLLLIAMSELLRGAERLALFSHYEDVAESRLTGIGRQFRGCVHDFGKLPLDLPFCALPDQVWESTAGLEVPRQRGRTRVRKAALERHGVRGGLHSRVHAELRSSARLFATIGRKIIRDIGAMPSDVAVPVLTALALPAWIEPAIWAGMDKPTQDAAIDTLEAVLARAAT